MINPLTWAIAELAQRRIEGEPPLPLRKKAAELFHGIKVTEVIAR